MLGQHPEGQRRSEDEARPWTEPSTGRHWDFATPEGPLPEVDGVEV